MASWCHPCHAGRVSSAGCCLHGPEAQLGFASSSSSPVARASLSLGPSRPSPASLVLLMGRVVGTVARKWPVGWSFPCTGPRSPRDGLPPATLHAEAGLGTALDGFPV